MERNIHPLLTKDTQYDIEFIYKGENKELYGQTIMFSCGINTLNNSWCYWWSYSNTMYVDNKTGIKNIVKGIRKKMEVLYDNFDWVKKDDKK